jgi:ankyrin repeat protein
LQRSPINIRNLVLALFVSLFLNVAHGRENKLHRLIQQGDAEGAYQYVIKLYEDHSKHRFLSNFFQSPEKHLRELNHQGQSPLALALAKDQVLVALLLVEKLEPGSRGKCIQKLFCAAIESGKLAMIQELVKHKLNAEQLNFNEVNQEGYTPLLIAVKNRNLELVQFLLDHGADLNQEFINGSRALAFAAEAGSLEIVKELLRRGAEINHINKQGHSALTFAMTKLHKQVLFGEIDLRIAEFLLSQGAVASGIGNDVVWSIIFYEPTIMENLLNQGLIEKLLKQGLEPNLIDKGGYTPLILAVRNAKLRLVQMLLDHGAKVDQELSNGSTALEYAAQSGNLEIVKELLKRGADLNHVNSKKHSALWFSLCRNARQSPETLDRNVGVAELLLDQGAIASADLTEVLLWAAETDRTSLATKLLRQGLNPNYVNSYNCTPMIMASKRGNLELVKVLLVYGANWEQEFSNGSKALAFAAQNGHLEIVKELLKRGASLNGVNKRGESVLWYSLLRDRAETPEALDRKIAVAEFLLDRGAIVTSEINAYLLWAASSDRKSLAEKLLRNGADPNYKNEQQSSPLMLASKCGNLDMIQTLIHYGADLEQEYSNGSTALSFAAQSGRSEAVKLLVELGAKIDHRGENGFTPLYWAVEGGKSSTMRLLLDLGADIQTLPTQMQLRLILSSTHLPILKSHLHQDKWRNFLDSAGNSCLHLAAQFGSFEAIQVLLESHADIEVKNKDRSTPAQMARLKKSSTGVYVLYYYPKIVSFSSVEELSSLKFNLLADLAEANKKNDSSGVEALTKLKALLNKKGRNAYFSERENVLETIKNPTEQDPNAIRNAVLSPKGECLICRDPLLGDVTAVTEGPAGCACEFCLDCAKNFARYLITSGGAETSKCPHCKGLTQLSFLKKLNLPAQDMQQILEFRTQAFNCTQPGFRACPGIDCSGGAQIEEGYSSRYTCLMCDFSGCLQCGQDHTGNCDGIDPAHGREIAQFLEEALQPEAKLRDCYYCGKIVLRESGCNDVTCPECKKHFHWNYGDHLSHPRWEEWKNQNDQVHDDQLTEKCYETLGVPHY